MMNIVLTRYHQSRIEKLSFRQAPLSTYTYIYRCISIDVLQNRYHFFSYSTTPVIIRRNSILAMSDRFNWLEIIQLLIYCPTLIDWKLFGIVIGESFMRILFFSLSFLFKRRNLWHISIFSPFSHNFIDSCQHFYATFSFVSISQYVSWKYQCVTNCV